MKQHEAVIAVMEESGGEATLGHLYQKVLRLPEVNWGTKTPHATIRRIVQDTRFFFKIRPGLWALKSQEPSIRRKYKLDGTERQKETATHSFYQGLLVELGNLQGFDTFIPAQDKNKAYVGRKLSEVASLIEFHPFGYDHLIRRARTIDVTWFNDRRMPACWYEVEHSTDINNSLLKFLDLQDFSASFRIVADVGRQREFADKLRQAAFKPIRERVLFLSYDQVAKLYEHTSMLKGVEAAAGL
jgi:hypothetical protein